MAQDVNNVTLIGRLTRDPELRTTTTGKSLCEASIAVNGSVKKGEGWEDYPNFFNVTVFGRQGEALAKHASKGHRIGVVGKLVQRRWDAQDGTKRERVQVSASAVQFLQSSANGRQPAPDTTPPVDDEVPF
jgi:single-strand DNA-binding protein